MEERGLAVQTFKAGPDFLDTGYHKTYSHRASRNLDAWLMGESLVRSEALHHTTDATGIIEGVMGLFDGASPTSEEGSTIELARWLNWPVILVLPAEKAGRSLAATLRGFIAEASPSPIVGVVLNGVSGSSHSDYLREAISPHGVPVLGTIPKNDLLRWPERHLGLQAAQELALPSRAELASVAEQCLDLDRIGQIATTYPLRAQTQDRGSNSISKHGKRVAVARDQAFHFYYTANLEWLEQQGVELVPFSPVEATSLPHDCDAVILGGGFPELYAQQLADNSSLRTSLASAIKGGLPCYAECGGLMLLSDHLISADGRKFPMTGVLPGPVAMTRSLQHFGYCLSDGTHRGHEFHHSQWLAEAEHANAWEVTRKRTGRSRREGFRNGSLHASYVHLYFSQSASFVSTHLNLLS